MYAATSASPLTDEGTMSQLSTHHGSTNGAASAPHRHCRVLVADHDPGFVSGVTRLLGRHGHEAQSVSTGEDAVRTAARTAWDVVLLDLALPDFSGADVLERLRALDPNCDVILVDDGGTRGPETRSAQSSAPLDLAALRAGAPGYVSKAVGPEQLLLAVEQAWQRGSQRRRELLAKREVPEAVGASPAWTRALDALASRAPGVPVLLLGEQGTGKRLAASLLHRWSDRAREAFVPVNAAALPMDRLENVLFGHAAAAPRDADTQPGLLELASGGTLFIDAVEAMSLPVQLSLLRLLEGHPAHRLGAAREIPVDVRVIAASDGDLAAAVRDGLFRADLYERLSASGPVTLPLLRERGEDVGLLALHFTAALSAELGKPGVTLSVAALDRLRAYPWPGNVRELHNAIESAVLLCDGIIRPGDLPGRIQEASGAAETGGAMVAVEPLVRLEDVVRRHVLAIFAGTRTNVTRSAEALGISRVALRRRLRAYGAKPPAQPSVKPG